MAERVTGEVVGVPAKANEQLQSVVTTSVTVKKQSGLKKLWKGFFVEDWKTVRGNVMENVVKPSIKSGIANAITSAVNMWLFGKNGYTNGPGGIFRPLWGSGTNYVNNTIAYNTLYANQNRIANTQNGGAKVTVGDNFGRYTSNEVYDPEYIRYATYADAENVYLGLCERIGKYQVATVKNLMDLSGMSGYEMVLQNWGWYDLAWHRVYAAGDGTWILKLPQPCPLNATQK